MTTSHQSLQPQQNWENEKKKKRKTIFPIIDIQIEHQELPYHLFSRQVHHQIHKLGISPFSTSELTDHPKSNTKNTLENLSMPSNTKCLVSIIFIVLNAPCLNYLNEVTIQKAILLNAELLFIF